MRSGFDHGLFSRSTHNTFHMKALLLFALLTATLAAQEPTKEELTAALQQDPKDAWALYNLGLMNYLSGDFEAAVKNWKALKEIDPVDWRAREKLVQGYWAAGDGKSASKETDELRKARESGKYRELNEKAFFICDQFQVGKVRAFVLQYYELTGERPLAWKFILKSGDETLDHHYSVGSYLGTTDFARAEGSIRPDERWFHLDGYGGDGSHATYNFYRNRPDYETVRQEVQKIIEGTLKPASATTPRAPKTEKR